MLDIRRKGGGACLGFTQSGKRCQRKVKGGWLCHQHKGHLIRSWWDWGRYTIVGQIFVFITGVLLTWSIISILDSGKDKEEEEFRQRIEQKVDDTQLVSHPGLSKRYPIGYKIFWANGPVIYPSEIVRLSENIEINMSSLHINMSESEIEVLGINMKGIGDLRHNAISMQRVVGYKYLLVSGINPVSGNMNPTASSPPIGTSYPFDVWLEYLGDDPRGANFVFGLAPVPR